MPNAIERAIARYCTPEAIAEESQKAIEEIEIQFLGGWFTWTRYYETWFYCVHIKIRPFEDRILESYFNKQGFHFRIANIAGEMQITLRPMSEEEKAFYNSKGK